MFFTLEQQLNEMMSGTVSDETVPVRINHNMISDILTITGLFAPSVGKVHGQRVEIEDISDHAIMAIDRFIQRELIGVVTDETNYRLTVRIVTKEE